MFPRSIDMFSTVINRDINGKKYLCTPGKEGLHTNKKVCFDRHWTLS